MLVKTSVRQIYKNFLGVIFLTLTSLNVLLALDLGIISFELGLRAL